MSPLRDALTSLFGWLTLIGILGCFLNGAPVWAWVTLVLVPYVAWATLGKLWFDILLGAILGISGHKRGPE